MCKKPGCHIKAEKDLGGYCLRCDKTIADSYLENLELEDEHIGK